MMVPAGNLTPEQRRFAVSFIESVLCQSLDAGRIPGDLLTYVFHEISRWEERASGRRDFKGNWEWTYSAAHRRGDLYVPYVDARVLAWAGAEGLPKANRLWPGGKKFALCLSHDVDFISRRSASLKFLWELGRRFVIAPPKSKPAFASKLSRHTLKLLAGPLIRRRSDEYHCFDTCMDWEDKFGFKSSFYFFAERLSKPHPLDCGYSHSDRLKFYGSTVTVRDMMHQMIRRGWEVGLHGSYHSATDLKALIDEKRQVEQTAGIRVTSTRQHYLHYEPRLTPSLHERAGLQADSTHGFNRNIGFRAGTAFPYFCWDHAGGRPTNVLEIPMQVMDGPLYAKWALEYGIEQAIEHVVELMDRVTAVGGCLTLNWHPSWLSRPLFGDVYVALLEAASQRGAWGCSVSGLREHWLTGHASGTASTSSLECLAAA